MMTEAGIIPGEADALPPKLLSGELRVKGAEKLVEREPA